MKQSIYRLQLFFFLSLVSTSSILAQVKYESGSILTTDGKQVDCLIKNYDWRQNPDNIEYKIKKGDPSRLAGLDDIVSFQIGKKSKYIKATVDIDLSKEIVAKLSRKREAEMETMTVFLEVILDGEVGLYRYNGQDVSRYFYHVNDSPIRPLIYKKYINKDDRIRENKAYVSELFSKVNCKQTKEDIRLVKYLHDDLLEYFKAYADCEQVTYTYYNDKIGRKPFALKLRAGMNYNGFSVLNANERWDDIHYGWKGGGRFGLEVEYVLPFQGNKWSLLADPNYQFFGMKEYIEGNHWGGSVDAEIVYRTIELPLGVSYKTFLSVNFSLFAKVLIVGNFSNMASVKHDYFEGVVTVDHEVSESLTYALGLGANIGKFTFEVRALPAKDILKYSPSFYGRHSYGAFILGYRLY